MKILLTGSNGMTGQKIVYRCLQKPDIELVATSRGANRLKLQNGYTYLDLDITDRNAVGDAINNHRPDVVINTAAMTNVDACESNKEACRKLNIDAVSYLVEACNAIDAHFIHLSTDFVFDGKNGPYSEDDAPNPISYYGWSKLEAERIIQAQSKDWAILRTILVVGVVEEQTRSNIILWVKRALEKGEWIRVVNDQYRMPTLAEDLAEACLLAAEKHANGMYHICGKDFLSTWEIANRVADYFGLDKSLMQELSSDQLNQPAQRPPITGFKLDKAIHELGYRPHGMDDILKIMSNQMQEIKA
ncbi:MAG: SDR family oxidoreductase [Flavobacteriales bacterium]